MRQFFGSRWRGDHQYDGRAVKRHSEVEEGAAGLLGNDQSGQLAGAVARCDDLHPPIDGFAMTSLDEAFPIGDSTLVVAAFQGARNRRLLDGFGRAALKQECALGIAWFVSVREHLEANPRGLQARPYIAKCSDSVVGRIDPCLQYRTQTFLDRSARVGLPHLEQIADRRQRQLEPFGRVDEVESMLGVFVIDAVSGLVALSWQQAQVFVVPQRARRQSAASRQLRDSHPVHGSTLNLQADSKVKRRFGYPVTSGSRKEDIVAEGKGSKWRRKWEVVVAEPYDRGNPADGAEESVLVQGSEAEARRVFADTIAVAASMGYEYVNLRSNGQAVETWPQATGWTS
jgi:hypothetical protein